MFFLVFDLHFSFSRQKNDRDKEHRQNVSHIISAEVRGIMNFKYKEIGKFDARKAAKALLELAQEIKLEDEKERKNEDKNDSEKAS